ncbi:MAG: NADH-quinone oxidoreductase subunit J [Gammaproteobacteria bacterium]
MNATFYVASMVAVLTTLLVVTRTNVVHALLYLVVSLLSVGLVFYTLGAPFAAALEVIIYAGAIVVLFVFVVMMLNLGGEAVRQERQWLAPGTWAGPGLFCAVLLGELIYSFYVGLPGREGINVVPSRLVGLTLFGPYVLAVELASMLLLAGLVGAYHLGRKEHLQR